MMRRYFYTAKHREPGTADTTPGYVGRHRPSLGLTIAQAVQGMIRAAAVSGPLDDHSAQHSTPEGERL